MEQWRIWKQVSKVSHAAHVSVSAHQQQAHLAFNWKTDEIIFEIRSDARKGGGGGFVGRVVSSRSTYRLIDCFNCRI